MEVSLPLLIFLQQCVFSVLYKYAASAPQDLDIIHNMRVIRKRLTEKTDFPWSEKELTPYLMNSKRLAKKGIVNRGWLSQQSIQNQLYKALRSENVSLYIFGESVSVGADLGKYNKEKVFHNILGFWWDSLFRGVTDSIMLRRNLAVGGVGSSYFARCWEEYLHSEESFDLALWEFNINDVGDETLHNSLEFFTRSLYRRYKRLDLMFTVFFRRSLYEKESDSSKRHELAENIVASHAHKYNITCFNIEPIVNHSKVELGLNDMFRNMHPSAFAHTQMAFLMIRYYTDVILDTLQKWIEEGEMSTPSGSSASLTTMMKRKHKQGTCKATCWSAVTPNYRKHIQAHSLFKLPMEHGKGTNVVKEGWKGVEEERYDLTGGYRATSQHAYITVYFKLKNLKAEEKLRDLFLAVRYSNMKSRSRIELQKVKGKSVIKDYNTTVIYPPKKDDGLKLYRISTIGSGEWKLTVKVLKGDFLLCALIIC